MQRNNRKVYIVSAGLAVAYIAMFEARGWTTVDDITDADLVQFTGGEDVSPYLYGEYNHATTHNSMRRDEKEMDIYEKALQLGIPMAGICRGGQFLNVMNGGKMFQDVNNHAIHGTHPAYIVGQMIAVQVSSTHHQMMRPNTSPKADCHILMTAGLATRRIHMSDIAGGTVFDVSVINHAPIHDRSDIEALYYGSTNCLCFQPHPEFTGPAYKDMTDLYFNWIDYYLFGEVKDGKEGDDNKVPKRPILPAIAGTEVWDGINPIHQQMLCDC